MALNERQQRFVDEYMIDGNATQAAIRAGYAAASATVQGSRLLANDNVRAALRVRKEEYDRQYEHRIMGKYEVLARLTEIARGDMGDLLGKDANGNIIDDVENLSVKRAKENGKSHLIKKVKAVQNTQTVGEVESQTITVELELYSAHDALRDLGKHHALFTERVQVDDWRSEAIELIRKGELSYEPLREELGPSLAEELFKLAGVNVHA